MPNVARAVGALLALAPHHCPASQGKAAAVGAGAGLHVRQVVLLSMVVVVPTLATTLTEPFLAAPGADNFRVVLPAAKVLAESVAVVCPAAKLD